MSLVLSGSDGITFPDTTEQDTGYANGIGFRNRIINGDMRIDQRNAGASGTANAYTVDRWAYYGEQASKGTWQQNAGSVTPPEGFVNYLGFTSSSAYSVLTGDLFEFYQFVEGFNAADLGWGTANAKTITISFWVRSSLTGTFGAGLNNSDGSRNYPFTYTISSANTWEQKTVTILGDTSGTWLKTNGRGIGVLFSLGAGSTYTATANAWNGTSNKFFPTGATSVVGTNGATWYITGVQLEVGSVATPFERRPYGTELMLCQRYYYFHTSFAETNFGLVGIGYNYTSSQMNAVVYFPTTMRIAPTLVATSGTNYYLFERNGADDFCNSLTINGATPKTTMLSNTTEISGTAGQAGRLLTYTSGASVAFNAEL